MKFFTLFTTLAVSTVLGTCSTITNIGYPKNDDQFKRGESIKLRVETESDTVLQQPGVSIRIEGCERGCYADGQHGDILYSGDYKPYYTRGRPELNYHDTFHVTIPSDFPKGKAAISVMLYDNQDYQDIASVRIHVTE